MLTLGQAARLTGLGKTTITRAIKAGRLSATRRDDGSYEIDPAELHRVYEIQPDTPETVSGDGHAVHHATPDERPRDPSSDPDVTARLAALEAQITGLKALLEEVRSTRDDLRADRDGWRAQAETAQRLLAAPPQPSLQVAPQPIPRGLFGWLRRAS